jgi:tetratricopeptide (TPR) repeat protein
MKSKTSGHRKVRVNLRALLIFSISLVALIALFAGVLIYRQSTTKGQSALLRQARELAHAKPPRYDLAGSYLKEYLNLRPDDPEALDLRAEILTDTANSPEHILSAIAASERVLRIDPKRAATRRKLVKLYAKLVQPPINAPALVNFVTARLVVDQLVQEEDAKANPDPAVYRLAAQIIEGQARMSNWKRELVNEAAGYYERALIGDPEKELKGDPKDIVAARALAELYFNQADKLAGRKKIKAVRNSDREKPQWEIILNNLLEANPTAETHLARHAVYLVADPDDKDKPDDKENDKNGPATKKNDKDGRAAREMKAAVALKPRDSDVLLEAANDALRRTNTGQARQYLDAIPQKDQSDPKVRLARGVLELYDNRADHAIESWRTSLTQRGGTDEDLSWRLAYVLLNLGRTDEAEPLINQYRRLTGGTQPTAACKYLMALKDLKENRPLATIHTLQTLRLKAPPTLEPQIDYTLGQAYEAIRDETQALEAYERATQHPSSKKSASPRLAKLRLMQSVRPEEAEVSLRIGLEQSPNDASLLIALARIEYQKQSRRPRERQKWEEVERLIKRTRDAAPDSGALALLEADYKALNGRTEDAIAMLGQAIKLDQNKKTADLWIAYANRLAMRGDSDEAMMVLERAADPAAAGDQASIRIARARLLTLQGHGQEARETLVRDIVKLPPVQRPLIWAALGDFYIEQKDYASARKAYQNWANLLPEDPKPQLFLLERALMDGGPGSDKIAEECVENLEKIGGVQKLYENIARAERLLVRPRGTVESPTARDERLRNVQILVDKIKTAAPQQRYGYLLEGQLAEVRAIIAEASGKMAEARDKFKEAINAYSKAMEYEGGQVALQKLVILYAREKDDAGLKKLAIDRPDSAQTQGRVAAEIAVALKDYERAKQLAAKVVENDPDSLDARVWQAKVLTAIGDLAGAESTLRALVTRNPNHQLAWEALLAWQIQRGQPKAAAATVEQIKAKVTTPQPEFLWARCYRQIGDQAHALENYEAALAKWPDDENVARSTAEFYEATGRAEQAEALIRNYLERNPKNRWAARALALVLSGRGRNNTDVWAEAAKLIGLTPSPQDEGDGRDRLTRAIVLARSADPAHRKSATKQLENLVSDLPHDFVLATLARRVLSELYAESGEPSKIRRQLEIEAQDNKPDAIARYAQSLMAEQLWDQAEKQIERLELIDPNQIAVVRLRALLLKGRSPKEPDPKNPNKSDAGLTDAIGLLEKYYEDRKDKPNAEAIGLEILRGFVDLGAGAEAARDRVATKLAERSPRTSWMLASFRAQEGKLKDAMELYAKAAENGSREAVENATALAIRDQSAERLKQADAVIDAALKLRPDDPNLLSKKGFLRHFQHDYKEEIRLYEQAIAHDPADYRFLNNMAWTLSEDLGQYDAALKRIDEAFKNAGAYPQFLDTRGVILTRLNRLDEAIKDFNSASKTAKGTSSYPTIQFHLARAYDLANRKEDARAAIENAHSAKPKLNVESLEPKERAELDELSKKLAAAPNPSP